MVLHIITHAVLISRHTKVTSDLNASARLKHSRVTSTKRKSKCKLIYTDNSFLPHNPRMLTMVMLTDNVSRLVFLHALVQDFNYKNFLTFHYVHVHGSLKKGCLSAK